MVLHRYLSANPASRFTGKSRNARPLAGDDRQVRICGEAAMAFPSGRRSELWLEFFTNEQSGLISSLRFSAMFVDLKSQGGSFRTALPGFANFRYAGLKYTGVMMLQVVANGDFLPAGIVLTKTTRRDIDREPVDT